MHVLNILVYPQYVIEMNHLNIGLLFLNRALNIERRFNIIQKLEIQANFNGWNTLGTKKR